MDIRYAEGIKKNKYSVYVLINPVNKYCFYVGYTTDPYDRYKRHVKKCPRSCEGQVRWKLIQSIRSLGLEVKMEELSKTFSYRGQAMRYESKLIKKMLENGDPLLNYPSKCIKTKFRVPCHPVGEHLELNPQLEDKI